MFVRGIYILITPILLYNMYIPYLSHNFIILPLTYYSSYVRYNIQYTIFPYLSPFEINEKGVKIKKIGNLIRTEIKIWKTNHQNLSSTVWDSSTSYPLRLLIHWLARTTHKLLPMLCSSLKLRIFHMMLWLWNIHLSSFPIM